MKIVYSIVIRGIKIKDLLVELKEDTSISPSVKTSRSNKKSKELIPARVQVLINTKIEEKLVRNAIKNHGGVIDIEPNNLDSLKNTVNFKYIFKRKLPAIVTTFFSLLFINAIGNVEFLNVFNFQIPITVISIFIACVLVFRKEIFRWLSKGD